MAANSWQPGTRYLWPFGKAVRAVAVAVALTACAAPVGQGGSGNRAPADIGGDAAAAAAADATATVDAAAVSDGAVASGDGADTTTATMDAQRRAALKAFAIQQLELAHAPSCAATIVKGGKLAYSDAWGLADVGKQKPATPDTIYMLASVSKTATAVGVMRAVELGLVQLDQDVNLHLPFSVRHPKFPTVPITLRMLLSHFSGIADNWDVMDTTYVEGDSPVPLGDFLHDYLVPAAKYYSAKKNWGASKPGTAYDYSDIGVSLAALVVEQASATPFEQWCKDKIFVPLGMGATAFRLAGLEVAQVALPYGWNAKAGYTSYGLYGYPDFPDGGLRSSAPQMARFLLMFAGDGVLAGQQVLTPQSVAEMKKVQYPKLDADQLLTWYLQERDGQTYIGHNGGDRGIYTEMFFRPSDRVGVLLFCNGEVDPDTPEEAALLALEQRLFDEGEAL